MRQLLKSAVLCSFILGAAYSTAAEVRVYGLIDLSLAYEDGKNAKPTLTMKPNTQSGSRFGIYAEEKLSADTYVFTTLEAQIQPDTGSIQSFHGKDDDFFGRQAFVGIHNNTYGEIMFGRLYAGTAAAGRHQTLAATDAFKCGYGDDSTLSVSGQQNTHRLNNAIQYATPTFAGWRAVGTFSFSKYEKDEADEFSDNNRFVDLAISHKGAKSYFMVGFNKTILGENTTKTAWNQPTMNFVVGGNYDFDTVKVFGQYRYTKHGGMAGYTFTDFKDWETNSVALGVQVPMFGGRFMASTQYMKAESQESADAGEYEKYTAGIGYQYFLSKKTDVYVIASYATANGCAKENSTENRTRFVAGLRHIF